MNIYFNYSIRKKRYIWRINTMQQRDKIIEEQSFCIFPLISRHLV